MQCRFCKTTLEYEFIDLASSPPSNSFLKQEDLNCPEIYYPLKLFVCHNCFLVQIHEYKKSQEIFNEEYIYFSSYSNSWLAHARKYVEMITNRLALDSNSFVVEIGSNDGYLLQYFKEKSIPCLGIEPSKGTAKVAREKNIDTITEFFEMQFALELVKLHRRANLLIGNNVLAHVPDICGFVKALKIVLEENGVITMEFPHLMRLVAENQFDTIYHEHYSYLSFHTVHRIFAECGLSLFDVEELHTHGGSLRIYAKHAEDKSIDTSPSVFDLLKREKSAGMDRLSYYQNFQAKADLIKYDLLSFLIEKRKYGKVIVAYGAAAKGNTLLNYCGVKKDLIDFVVDASPHKRNKFMPGSHIPVVHESQINKNKPHFVLILPWNIQDEIMEQLTYIRQWGGKFVIPIPKLEIK
jgi:SAM-dependent methyltransferase